MTALASLRTGDLVRVRVATRGRASHDLLARWEGTDDETGLAVLRPIDRVGRLYLDPAEIRAVDVIDGRGKP